jgi:NAD(P)-dependent dehydrogenase (short-subunit alcohol dehydrogenase family)
MIPVFPDTKVALKGKKGLIVGIANDQSIAWGCAKAFRALGADLAVTYLNDRAKKHVEPLAQALEAPIFMPMDVMVEGQTEQVFERIEKEWGTARFPAALDRLLAEGGAPWARGGRRPRRLPQDDGRLVLVVHANGPSGRAIDEEWRERCSP